MTSLWPPHLLLASVCVLLYLTAPPSGLAADDLPSLRAEADFTLDDTSIPERMLDLMRESRLRYLEGAELLRAGESASARDAFDLAVDLILESEWDLPDHPQLEGFFRDLVRRIHQEESRYLLPGDPAEESAEKAVVDELGALDLIPITIDPSVKDVAESDLGDTLYDIPVVLNERVHRSLNYWLTKGRKYFVEGLMRSGRYRDMIEKTFREHSIPRDLLYLAQVESLFKPNAFSRAAAKGIWQFAAQTARRYGLVVNSVIDERSDPEKSTRAAARYLSDLYAMFQDWNLAMAAYNWGEAKVQRLVNRTGESDFWKLAEQRRSLPAETRNHIPLVMASIILGKNPEKYGLPSELDPAMSYSAVVLDKPVDLRAAAKELGVPVEELKRLNPALRRHTTPPNYPGFVLKIPPDSDPESAQRVASLPTVKVDPGMRHKVRPGETLSHIAARYNVSVRALQDMNAIRSPRLLRAGTYLEIPAPR